MTQLPRHFELGALATGRWSFYERLGWERWRGPTFARDGDEVIRTEDDDDAVMVLRFGPSADDRPHGRPDVRGPAGRRLVKLG